VAAGLFAIQPGNEPTFELTGLGADARIMVDGAEGVEGVRDFRHKKENQEFFAKAQIRRMPTQGKDQNILTFLIFNPDIPGTKFLFSVNINNDPNVHDKQWSYTKPWEDANPTISYRFTDHAPLLNPAPNLVVVHSGNKLRDDGLSLGLYPYHRRPQESESFPTFHLFEMEEIKGSSVLIDHERTKKAPFSVSYKNNTLSSPGVLSVPPGERALKLQGTVFLQKPMSEDEAREKLKVIGKINPGGSDISGQTVELNKTGDDSFEFTVTVPFSGQPGVFDATFQVRVDEEGGDKAYVTDFGSYRVKVEMDDRVRLFDDDGRRETVDEATLILARLAGADGELADLLKRVLTDLLGNVTMDGAVISSSRLADDSPQPFHWVRDGMSLAEVLFQLLQMEAMNGGETVWAAISKQFDFLARAYGVRQNAAGEYEVDGDLFAKRFSLSGQYLSGQRADGAAHVARFMTAYLEAGRIRNSPPDANHEKQALALLEKAVDVMGKDLVNPAFSAPVADMDLKQRQRFELLDPWNRTGGFHAADHLLFGYAVQELSRAIPILIAGGLDGDRLRKLEPFLGSAMTSLRLILPQYARERNGDIGPAMNAHKTLQGMTDPADSQVIGALAQGDEPLIRLTNEAVLGTYNELDDAFRGAISGPLKERFPHVVAWGRRRPDNGTEPSCPLSMIWAARFNLAMVRRMLKDNQFKLPSETHLAFLKNQGIDIGGLKAGEVVDASNPMFRVILTALFRRAEETLNFLATNAPKDGSLSSRLRIEGESVAFEGAPGHTLTNSAFIMAMLDRQRTAAAMGTPTPVVAGLPAPSAQRWGNLAVVAARAVDAIALGNLRGFSALFTAGFSEAVLKAWKTGQDLDRKWGEEEQLAAMFEIAMANRRAMNSGESARLREAVGSLLPAGARVVGENADGQWIVFHIEFHGQPMQVRVAVSDVPPFYDDPENHTLALNRVEEDGTRTILFEAPVLERGFSASDLVIGHELDEVVGGMRHKEARKAELEVAKALRSRRERLAAQEKASGDVAVSYWKVERAKTRAEADQIISDIGVREGATPSLGLDMSFVARRAIEAVGSSRTTGDVEMSLSQAVQEGKTTAVLFVDSAAAIGDWLRIRLALEDFAKAGKVLVVTPDETIADKLGKTLNVEVAISPFEDLGNGLFGLDVLALKRGSGTFAKYLESGNYTFYHSSIVRLSVGKSAGGSETEEVEALKRAVDAAKVLLSFLRVMPPAAIDWNLMNRILAAVAQAA